MPRKRSQRRIAARWFCILIGFFLMVLALDWLANILVNYPVNGDAFLLVDYPGYGKNAGYAMIDSTRASADAAVRALEERLHMPEERFTVCAIGHSLGAAVALDFANRHRV